MQKIIRTIFIISSINTSFAASSNADFMSPAHMLMGNDVKLKLSANDPGQAKAVLHMQNGLVLTYGDILALPDFYGIMTPIAFAATDEEKIQRFHDSFKELAEKNSSRDEAKRIVDIINEEYAWVIERMQKGESSETAYKNAGYTFDMKFNCATGGGGCNPTGVWWMKPGRYLNLTAVNFDHFGDHALIAYQAGHKLALSMAVMAHQTGNLQTLETAYAMNAFACHFLSDRFAAGHIRTPRLELTTKTFSAPLGSLLSNYMHDEENAAGLHVHNQRGDRWIAYGDKSWFNPKIEFHKNILHEALQASADEIFEAYKLGTTEVADKVVELIPIPDELASSGNVDIAPLFYWDEHSKQLMRRSNVYDHYDRHWTGDWWVLTTLYALSHGYNLPEKAQAMLYLHSLSKAESPPAFQHLQS